MKTEFDKAFEQVIEIEGGYVNNPDDPGGKTRWGITESTARRFGYKGALSRLSRDDAKDIYQRGYWDAMQLDLIAAISPAIAQELFECGVNCGLKTAVEILQRSLNVANRKGRDYFDIRVDGRVGPVTRKALAIHVDGRGSDVLLKAMNCLQGARYIELAERNSRFETFLNGWLTHRVHLINPT